MDQRKKLAKMQRELEEKEKEMTPEEIEEMEKNIPEWKRNALVMSGEEAKPEKKGMFGKLKEKISSTDAAKKFQESEDYEKLNAMRANYAEFKSNLKEGVDNT